MDKDLLKSLQQLIPATHFKVGAQNISNFSKSARALLNNRRLPDEGWSDLDIELFLHNLASMDSNNFNRGVGVGEREGRVYSQLVAKRNYYLSHGIGRSGDLTEPQPKAAGSSIIYKLTHYLLLDMLKRGCKLLHLKHALILPLATGMSIQLTLVALKQQQPLRNIVLWSRIDQKSCFKAIIAANCTCIVIPTRVNGDEVETDLEFLLEKLEEYKTQVLAVITTASCFAPRVPDSIDEVAKLCQKFNVNHVINNAYGLQCSATNKLLNRACVVGRVDAVISSTDKNFMVPVGGAFVYSPDKHLIQQISRVYAGRASGSAVLDLFITFLSMGLSGYQKLLNQRESLLHDFTHRLDEVSTKYGERLLICPRNTISYGITVNTLDDMYSSADYNNNTNSNNNATYFGSVLFTRCVSGTRIISKNSSDGKGNTKVICQQEFVGFGSSTDNYHESYMTAACAVGLTQQEIDEFSDRLDKAFKEAKQK